jgi:hypothetical protein
MCSDHPPANLDSLIQSFLGGEMSARVTYFPSGSVDIDVRFRGHFAIILSLPATGEWGVSIDVTDDKGFLGADHIFGSAEDAIRATRNLLLEAAVGNGRGQ